MLWFRGRGSASLDNSNCVISSYRGTNVGGVSNRGIPEGTRQHGMMAPGNQGEMVEKPVQVLPRTAQNPEQFPWHTLKISSVY